MGLEFAATVMTASDDRAAGPVADPRLPELFARAQELAGAERAAWLAALRSEEPALAREVEELLAAAAAGERRFAAPAWERLSAADGDEGEPPPERVGPYRIEREIGRGGMGRVFLAEQEEAEFRRLVALKVLHRPAGAADSLRRFHAEARILAALEHPGIARLYDAGRGEDGGLYLALEYVEGEDLLSFVGHRALDLRARVELFVQVLDAVDFAHRRLVVHRDLKPGNVIVDAEGRPKLLDFGISKVLDAEAADGETGTGLRALTPAYASPEQRRGEAVTTASDVYSLGVVLYEMLAGRRPFARAGGWHAEIESASRGEEPAPPSTAARQVALETTSEASTVPRWRELAGDLDAITLKALRPEPESRYHSAAAFAADLRRWLRGQPVEARRGGRRYRLAKLLARHRAAASFAGLAALALVAGVAGTLLQARRATREAAAAREHRDFALRQLSRAEAVNELNAFLLYDAAPGGKPFTAGELLGRAEEILRRQRGGSPEDRAELLVAIGQQYLVQDEDDKALRLLDEAYTLARRSADPGVRAKTACSLAAAVSHSDDFARAERLFAEGIAELEDEPQLALHRVFCLQRGSEVARWADEGERAVERAEAARALLRRSGQGSPLAELRVAMDVAESLRDAGRLREADAAFAQAWQRLEAMGRGETERAGTLLNNWALVRRGLGQPLAAERLYRRAVAIASADGGEASVEPMLFANLGRTLVDLARLDEARRYAELADAGARRSGDDVVLTHALFLRNFVYSLQRDLPAAARTMVEIEPRIRESPPDHYYHTTLAYNRAMLAQARGDAAGARAAFERALSLMDEQDSPVILLRRSAFALAQGELAMAEADAARALAVSRRNAEPGARSSRVGLSHLALARALRARGKHAEAAAAAAEAMPHLETALGADHPDTRAARELAAGRTPPPPQLP